MLKHLLSIAAVLLLASCSNPQGSAPSPRQEFQDESAVSNGGNILTALLHNVFTREIPEHLRKEENRGMLGDSEREKFLSFLQNHGIPIVPVRPLDILENETTDRFGKKALVLDGALVDEFSHKCTERLVYYPMQRRWVLEIDEREWNEMTSHGQVFPQEKTRRFLKIAFQYAYVKKVLDRSGDSPDDLILPMTKLEVSTGQLPRRKKVNLVAGSTFAGDVYCPSLRFDFDALPKPVEEEKHHRCKAKITFSLDGKAIIYAEEPNGTVYLNRNDLTYSQEHVVITLRSGKLKREVSLLGWGNDEVMTLTAKDKLYKEDASIPKMEGKTYRSTLFCEIALETGGLLKPAPWKPRDPVPVVAKDICELILTLKTEKDFEVIVKKKDETELYKGTGRYRQIGVNLLLKHYKTGEEGYAWLCPECKKHLVLGAGEFLLDEAQANAAEDMPEAMYGKFFVKETTLSELFPRTHQKYDTPVGLQFIFERFESVDEKGFNGVVRLKKTELIPNGLSTTYVGYYREAGLTVVVEMLSFTEPLIFKNQGDALIAASFVAEAEACESCDEDLDMVSKENSSKGAD